MPTRGTSRPAVRKRAVTRRPDDEQTLTFHAVDEKRWVDFARLFERRGGPGYCWCMVWRAQGEEARRAGRAERKAAMRKRVKQGTPIGLLGYLGDEPVAWCSIAPRETYREGLGGLDAPEDTPGSVWSLTCLFIAREARGQGMTRQLIEAAIAHARKEGAKVLEAYPVDPESPSYRFMGFVGSYEALGFQAVGREGSRRHVYRYALGARGGRRRARKVASPP
ncbi:N-acetyltransferase family protein [Myxococcus fulvus]|uniref:GNAT family N-acetyltransferase n=1 Tax=Myxococcus fulvus TaxID=33 RepID=UPI003B9B2FE5